MKYTRRQPPAELKCPQCKKTFTRGAGYVRAKRERNPSSLIFCSPRCFHLYRHGAEGKNVPCVQCGKSVHVEPNARKDRGGFKYGPFCSRACYGEWRSTHLVGADSPQWKGGYALDYGGSHWKSARRKARERDRHTCQDCGVTEQAWGYELDVHHIIPYDLFDDPKEANDLSNLVTLCRDCHVKRHQQPVQLPLEA